MISLMARPVHLYSLAIHGVRTFESIEVNFKPPEKGGQWIVFLGNNGSGKTTLLRSIAMAFSPMQRIIPYLQSGQATGSFLRNGHRTGSVAIQTGADRYRIDLMQFQNSLELSQNPERAWFFVAGYGGLRGIGQASSIGRRGEAVASLFVPQAPLIDPQVWLIQNRLRYYESKAGIDNGGEENYRKIEECLIGLLPDVEAIDVRSSDIEVLLKGGERVSFASLSDGYLTTAAWILDMIAAWLELNPDAHLSSKSIAEQMTGVALVDEIDLHLHPIWQRQVISQIRAAFPNMTFIVTTHSPLTILDVHPGELFVIDQASIGEASTVAQVDLRPGDVDDILTGAWFNLSSTLDSGTEALMERHRQLLSDQVPEDNPELKELERKLRRRLDGFGTASIDRMVQSVANEVVTDDLREVPSEERMRARDSLLKLVKEQNTT